MSKVSCSKHLPIEDHPEVTGVANWVSSDIHAKTELAKGAEEQKALYKQWATSYDDEMEEHNLASYKSVTAKAIPLLTNRPMTSLSIIDVGCGTGLLGQHFRELLLGSDAIEIEEKNLTLVATDLSPDMLAKAAAKNCFDHLEASDLKQPLPFANESFDIVLSSGVFLPGHCGSESVPNLLAILKVGGYAVFTVREVFFRKEYDGFLAAITDSGCELLEADLMPYYGEIEANVLVVRKIRSNSFTLTGEYSEERRCEYETKGWASLGVILSPLELAEIQTFVESRVRDDHPGNIFDSHGKLRAVHGYDTGFAPQLMICLADLAKQFIGCEQVYVYQFRVNSKQPVAGGSWKPHRDYDFWARMDGLPSTRIVLFHILVNEHYTTNGPVIMCNGSHQVEVEPSVASETGWKVGFNEDGFKYTIKQELIDAWVAKTALVGPAGTVAVMNPLTWHYSEPNTTDEPRVLLSVVFNDVNNVNIQPEGTEPRPEFIVQQPSVIF